LGREVATFTLQRTDKEYRKKKPERKKEEEGKGKGVGEGTTENEKKVLLGA